MFLCNIIAKIIIILLTEMEIYHEPLIRNLFEEKAEKYRVQPLMYFSIFGIFD